MEEYTARFLDDMDLLCLIEKKFSLHTVDLSFVWLECYTWSGFMVSNDFSTPFHHSSFWEDLTIGIIAMRYFD